MSSNYFNLFPNINLDRSMPKNIGPQVFDCNRNIFHIATLSTKLLIDITLRDDDPELLSNQIVINFVSVMRYCLISKIKNNNCLYSIIKKHKETHTLKLLEIFETIDLICTKNNFMKLAAFIILLLMKNCLVNFLNLLYIHKINYEQYFNPDAFIFSDEMKIFLDFLSPLDSIDFLFDINSFDFDERIFTTIDFSFIFSAQLKLMTFFPTQIKNDIEYPELTPNETITGLKNQNIYLETYNQQLTEKNENMIKELENFKKQNHNLSLELQLYKEKYHKLEIEVHEMKFIQNENSEILQKHKEQNAYLKQTILERENEMKKIKEKAEYHATNYQEISKQREILKNQLVLANSESKTLKDSRDEIFNRYEIQKSLIKANEGEIKKLQKECNDHQNVYNKILAELHRTQNQLANKDLEITTLKDNIKKHEDCIEELEKNAFLLEMSLEEIGNKLSKTTLEASDYKEKVEMSTISPWIDDSMVHNCQDCNQPFTLARRKHHCRKCGLIFCQQCSSNRVPLENNPSIKHRVCDKCFATVLQLSTS